MISDKTCNFQMQSVLNRLSTVNCQLCMSLLPYSFHPGPIDLTDSTCDFSKYICIVLIKLHCGNYKEPHRFLLIHHFIYHIYHIYHIWDILGPGDLHFVLTPPLRQVINNAYAKMAVCWESHFFKTKAHRRLCRMIVRKTKTQRLIIMLILLC